MFKRPLRKNTHLFAHQMFIMSTNENTVPWANWDAGKARVVVGRCQGHGQRADLSQAWGPGRQREGRGKAEADGRVSLAVGRSEEPQLLREGSSIVRGPSGRPLCQLCTPAVCRRRPRPRQIEVCRKHSNNHGPAWSPRFSGSPQTQVIPLAERPYLLIRSFLKICFY